MKIINIVLIITVMTVSSCIAADLHFSWTPNTDATQGYRLLMDGGTNVVQDIQGRESAETTYTAPDDGKCHAFALIAYAGDMVSDPSDFATWCPPKPGMVGTFKITIEPIQ